MAIEVRRPEDLDVILDSDLDGVINGDPGTTYTLRTLGAEKVRELRKPYHRERMNPRTHQREEVPLGEEEAASYLLDLLDYAVKEWTGVLYQGEPLPCTRDNKALLDTQRKTALLQAAGMNRARPGGGAASDTSFRQSA